MRNLIFSVLFLICTINTASAQEFYGSDPKSTEKLERSVPLKCAGMTIDEWRPDSHYPSITGLTQEGIDVLNVTCEFALLRYSEFLEKKGFRYQKEPLNAKISMIPANILLDGRLPRSLNDTAERMKIVGPDCCNWGVWHKQSNRLFMRNDPIYTQDGKSSPNIFWQRTFLHEMAHVLNDQWHVMARNYPGNRARDEDIAEEWVAFLGIQYPTESSDDDLKFKKIHEKNN